MHELTAEIITIGNEVLSGRTVNTNASHIAGLLEGVGIDVRWVTTCGDDATDVAQAFRLAWDRARVIITTGGIGPTHDDITSTVFCDVFQRDLRRDESVLTHIEEMFHKRGRVMTDRNRTQADVPVDTEVLMNHEGTAPGVYLAQDGRHWFMLPGVPREMRHLMSDVIIPLMKKVVGNQAIMRRDLHVVGWPESNLMDTIEDVEGIESVASLPDEKGEITLRISAVGTSVNEVEARIDSIHKQLEERLSQDIYGVDTTTLEGAVGSLLRERGWNLAVAESITGGLVGSRITDEAGSSDYFLGGVTAYSNEAKQALLGVSADLLADYGAVSEPVAEAMAAGARTAFDADIAVSLPGIAGPTGGTETKPVGLVCIGLASMQGTSAKSFNFGTRRGLNKVRAAQAALDMVRRHLLSTQ
jgi:nicotinamide-nucleotide amidase